MQTLIGVMMKLIQSEVCETPLDESIKEHLSEELLEQLYRISKSHDLAHIVGSALDDAGLLPEGELAEKFRSQCFAAVFRHERMQYEYERICETLEKAGVDFMPLKGPIIRAYYPKPWQRTSCDIDILVHEEVVDDTARMLCEQMGFEAESERLEHDISLRSPNGIHLELHFSLKGNVENIDPTLFRVWEYARPVEGWKHAYRQAPEFFVFHSLSHMAGHFIYGGCGLRS